MDKIKCTLIIATYNWPEALQVCLTAIRKQSVLPNEIIIADDGSTMDTAELIKKESADFPCPLKHVWHEDDGFQKTIILNKAIAQATCEYIIQIDGDVVPHKLFIQDHLAFAQRGSYVAGTRVNTNKALKNKIIAGQLTELPLLASGSSNFFNSLRIPFISGLMQNYRTSESDIYYVKGCNMAFWKSDFIAVNGYDESFTGWGLEDSDLAIRLYNNGVKKRYLKMAAIVYHLWHPHFSRAREEINNLLMNKAAEGGTTQAAKGVDQYLSN